MSKVIRITLAIAASFLLSFVWSALLPTTVATIMAVVSGVAIGFLFVSKTGELVTQPVVEKVAPVYRVEVAPDDYEAETPINELYPSLNLTPRWDDPKIVHLHGVKWFHAPIPPKRHECWGQTDAWMGLEHLQRCACGAIRSTKFGWPDWLDRNSRKPKVDAA